MPGSSKWLHSLTFTHLNPVRTSPLYHTCYMPHPSHSSGFDHLNNVWEGVQIIKFLILWFSPLPCYLVPLRHIYLPQHPLLEHPQSTFLPQFEQSSFIPIQNNRQNYSSVCLILYILDNNLEDKIFCFELLQALPYFNLLLTSSWLEFWFIRVETNSERKNTI